MLVFLRGFLPKINKKSRFRNYSNLSKKTCWDGIYLAPLSPEAALAARMQKRYNLIAVHKAWWGLLGEWITSKNLSSLTHV